MKYSIPLKENHVALWMWLSRNPKKEKEDWPGFDTIARVGLSLPENECFACQYCCDRGLSCKQCPVDWSPRYCVTNRRSLFFLWERAKCNIDRSRLAKQIAEAWK